jgi:FKBP-type peptidyl-prolyl cis-trans isomerase FkpA
MKQFFNAALICIVALSACTTPFKKAKDGSLYKVISTKKGPRLITGNYMEMSVIAKYKDSVLGSSVEDGMPQYGIYDTANFPPPYKEVFKNIHVGDSIVLKIPTDSILAKGQAAPFIKKGQFIYQYYTITNVFTSKEQVDSAQNTHMKVAKERGYIKQTAMIEKMLAEKDTKEQLAKDSKIIEDYLAKNNIKATKTKWGSYIVVQNEGTGPTVTNKDVATVNYTGKSLDSGKVFDSNVDPKFKHVEPYDVDMTQLGGPTGVILGWTDVVLQMKKGAKVTAYIPSTLGYGKNGRQTEIAPDEILVFDIELLNITDEAGMKAHQEETQKKQMADQQRMMDSLQKAAPKTAPKK